MHSGKMTAMISLGLESCSKLPCHCNFQMKLVQCLLTNLPLEMIGKLLQNVFNSMRSLCYSNTCCSRRSQAWFLIDFKFL